MNFINFIRVYIWFLNLIYRDSPLKPSHFHIFNNKSQEVVTDPLGILSNLTTDPLG